MEYIKAVNRTTRTAGNFGMASFVGGDVPKMQDNEGTGILTQMSFIVSPNTRDRSVASVSKWLSRGAQVTPISTAARAQTMSTISTNYSYVLPVGTSGKGMWEIPPHSPATCFLYTNPSHLRASHNGMTEGATGCARELPPRGEVYINHQFARSQLSNSRASTL
eukprot:6209165-Pleurochrysis_carterae.AAC.2